MDTSLVFCLFSLPHRISLWSSELTGTSFIDDQRFKVDVVIIFTLQTAK